jgi:hypothetical protein
MSTDIVTRDAGAIAEQVAIVGDLSKLSPDQRMAYYGEVCKSVGLNPLTRPFQYIQLNGKLTLYATRDATDQMRRLRGVSIAIVGRERIEDVYVVTAHATTPDGRADESTGAVALGSLKGENLANALMKAETKAKRRVTLSICGLGWLDESELDTIRDARPTRVDYETGEVLDSAPARPSNARQLPSGREALVGALRAAYAEAKKAGADVAPPSRDEVAGWSDEMVRQVIATFRAAALEVRAQREAEPDELDAAASGK